jgi:hypothetical protein
LEKAKNKRKNQKKKLLRTKRVKTPKKPDPNKTMTVQEELRAKATVGYTAVALHCFDKDERVED